MNQANRPAAQVGYQAFFAFLCLLLTLPLAAHWVAMWVGWRIFFLADPRIQVVWATLLQLVGAWPFYAGLLQRRGALDGLVAVGTALLYGYGFFLTYWRPQVASHPYFQWQAVILTVVTVDRLVVAVLNRRRATFQ